jgi:hypothetical protein
MDNGTSLRQLQGDWSALVADSRTRDVVAGWGELEPTVAGCSDLADVIGRCSRRDDAVAANAALAGLLRLAATDPLAERAALQAVVPGLKALAARARRMGWSIDDVHRRTTEPTPWVQEGELEQELVMLAWEQIRALAGDDVAYAALRILEPVWRRLRSRLASHRRRVARHVPLWPDDGDEELYACESEGTWERRSAELVRDAVHAGVMKQRDAEVIYGTRVLGYPVIEVAEQLQVDVKVLWARRRRAERALGAALQRSLADEAAA